MDVCASGREKINIANVRHGKFQNPAGFHNSMNIFHQCRSIIQMLETMR